MKNSSFGFSLVEVVLSLGLVGFAIIAILGVLPVGLQTGRSAQDETRAAQIAQDILTSIVSQAQAKYPNVTVNQAGSPTAQDFSYNVKLTGANTYTFSADNDGHLAVPTNGVMQYPYQIVLTVTPDPPGFDPGNASLITVRVMSPPSAGGAAKPGPNQLVRDYTRIVTKY